MILRFKASPCTAIAMFGDFADDDLVRQFINGWWVCSWAMFVIDALGRTMVARLACRIVFVHAAPFFQNETNKNLFPTSMSVSGAKTRLYIYAHP